jgi:hypothetical protein
MTRFHIWTPRLSYFFDRLKGAISSLGFQAVLRARSCSMIDMEGNTVAPPVIRIIAEKKAELMQGVFLGYLKSRIVLGKSAGTSGASTASAGFPVATMYPRLQGASVRASMQCPAARLSKQVSLQQLAPRVRDKSVHRIAEYFHVHGPSVPPSANRKT